MFCWIKQPIHLMWQVKPGNPIIDTLSLFVDECTGLSHFNIRYQRTCNTLFLCVDSSMVGKHMISFDNILVHYNSLPGRSPTLIPLNILFCILITYDSINTSSSYEKKRKYLGITLVYPQSFCLCWRVTWEFFCQFVQYITFISPPASIQYSLFGGEYP